MPRAELESLQAKRLLEIVPYVYERAPLYRETWDAAGVKPRDIKSVEDFRKKIPFINKDSVRAYRDKTDNQRDMFLLTRDPSDTPDEPRYAAIAQHMAATGDYLSPVLWGEPWFEKPALLYWLSAAGFRLGLPGEYAPRLPVALLSLLFLAYFYPALSR